MIITLIGYMGSGKSTTGKILAKTLGFEFIDLDHFIEEEFKTTIATIFEKEGELGFRKKERAALTEVLQKKNVVLSVGGGTPMYYNNIELINENSVSVYLRVALPELVKRLENNKAQRPLIAHIEKEELAEFIAKHLFERNLIYQQAHHTLAITNQTTLDILDRLLVLLKND